MTQALSGYLVVLAVERSGTKTRNPHGTRGLGLVRKQVISQRHPLSHRLRWLMASHPKKPCTHQQLIVTHQAAALPKRWLAAFAEKWLCMAGAGMRISSGC